VNGATVHALGLEEGRTPCGRDSSAVLTALRGYNCGHCIKAVERSHRRARIARALDLLKRAEAGLVRVVPCDEEPPLMVTTGPRAPGEPKTVIESVRMAQNTAKTGQNGPPEAQKGAKTASEKACEGPLRGPIEPSETRRKARKKVKKGA
jgi:hypothetical protein